jgi:RNase P protein component
MLFGISIQAFEKLRSGRVFEFNSGGESENIVPIVFDQLGIDIKFRQNFIAKSFIAFTFFKRIETMPCNLLKPGREVKRNAIRRSLTLTRRKIAKLARWSNIVLD